MPFTLTPDLFTAPPDGEGEFKAGMFPAGDRDQIIDKLISVATAQVADLDESVQERAATAFVNWRLWEFVADANQSQPESVTLDSGRTAIRYGQQARSHYQSRANQAKAKYDDYFTFEDEFIAT